MAIPVSALVNGGNLTSLFNAINDQMGNTGILATLSGDKIEITLTQSEGFDIKIANYTHSDAGDTMLVEGNESDTPTLVILESGTATDSTVIGGKVSFYANGLYSVSSSVATNGGSIFNNAADAPNGSALFSIDDIESTP